MRANESKKEGTPSLVPKSIPNKNIVLECFNRKNEGATRPFNLIRFNGPECWVFKVRNKEKEASGGSLNRNGVRNLEIKFESIFKEEKSMRAKLIPKNPHSSSKFW